jgi:hypothetical protein
MKKLIGYPICQTLYWLGHYVSRVMERYDWAFLYGAYSRLMGWSIRVNDWAGLDVWVPRGAEDFHR